MGIAERLVVERKRLQLSQAEFAKRVGISLSSQKRYEKGDRPPDACYLESLGALGVDTYYLAFGHRTEDFDSAHYVAMTWLLMDVASALGLERNAFTDAVDQLSQSAGALDGDDAESFSKLSDELLKKVLRGSPLFHDCLSQQEMKDVTSVVELVEATQQQLRLTISPKKKAQLVMMAYRALKTSGKLDASMIEGAVRLASG